MKIALQSQGEGYFFCSVRGNPILSKVDFVGSPLTQNARTLGRDCHRQYCFAFSFHLQTHQVLSEAKKSDAEKREKLLDLYARTEVFLDQLDTDFIKTLQASLGDFKTTLRENIESFKPTDQYIVLVAGKFFILFLEKRDIKYIPIVFYEQKLIENFTVCFFFFTFYVVVIKTNEIQ